MIHSLNYFFPQLHLRLNIEDFCQIFYINFVIDAFTSLNLLFIFMNHPHLHHFFYYFTTQIQFFSVISISFSFNLIESYRNQLIQNQRIIDLKYYQSYFQYLNLSAPFVSQIFMHTQNKAFIEFMAQILMIIELISFLHLFMRSNTKLKHFNLHYCILRSTVIVMIKDLVNLPLLICNALHCSKS